MRRLNAFKYLSLAGLVALAIIFTVVWSFPSSATSSSYELPGIQIRTPHDLNLDYLNKSTPRPIADLAGSIIPRARNKVQNTTNVQVAIPIPSRGQATIAANRLGVNSISEDTSVSEIETGRSRTVGSQPGRYRVVANRNSSGRAEPITPPSLDGMFAEEERRGGLFNRYTSGLIRGREYLVADASGKYAQANDLLTFDLIAVDTYTNRLVEIAGVNADSFCADALNAVIEGTWRVSNIDVESL